MNLIKKLIFLGLSLPIFGTAYSSCSNTDQRNEKQASNDTKNDATYHKKNFDSLMSVDKNLHLDYYEELLNDKAFVSIYEHSSLYLNDAIAFLSKNNFNTMQAEVCICAMQNLDAKHYIGFCKFYLSLYENKRIVAGVLQDAILTDFLKKRIIIDNYTNPDVISLLNGLKNDKNMTKDFRRDIPDILSGKAKKDLDDFYANK